MIRFPLILVCLAGLTTSLQARPPYKKALADYYGPFLPARLNDCRTCHLPAKPGDKEDADDKPHNPFGARLKKVKKELEKAGQKTDIISRLQAIADEDSDGDGVANLLEILAGRNPGEADDKPTDAELADAHKKLVAFKARVYYRWNPFETVQRPGVPTVKNNGWVRNPIDAFLAADHEARGLKPRPEAPRHILVRRLYLDLTGLPPTLEELEAAANDRSGDWFEKIVDRLLASPRYGERWGRHWMDVWRYADWAGYGQEIRDSREHIWQWRDWIVESLNADKPYDRMVTEMLAGDELAPDDPKTLRATGFLVRHYYKFSRDTWLEGTVEHTSKAFLGFTMNCARCHDHFFDTDISQKDYYRFRAIFEPYNVRVDRLPGEPNLTKLGLPRAFDARPAEPTYLYVRGNQNNPDKASPIPPGVPAALGGPEFKLEPVQLPLSAYCPDKRDFVIKETRAASAAAIPKARETATAAQRSLFFAATQLVGTDGYFTIAAAAGGQRAMAALALAEIEVPLAETRHAALLAAFRAEALEDAGKKDTGEWKQAATEANRAQHDGALLEARKALLTAQQAIAAAPAKTRPELTKKAADTEKLLAKAEADVKQPAATTYTKRAVALYPHVSTGRRLALARWITDSRNPLTARVAVNHMWLRHFGAALVPSVFDFGQNGRAPTNPALLDWLAAELMATPPASGGRQSPGAGPWSMKRLHRLLVTSSAYRMDSATDTANGAIDRDNQYLWRMNSHRMEAELVRDSVLSLGGQLDLTMGGPEVPFTQGLTSKRRSLYLQHAAEKQTEFLALFDAANVSECYQRTESVIPQQALALSNSTLVLGQSRVLAAKLSKQAGEEPAANAAFVKLAFQTVLGRPPADEEQATCEKFLTEQTALLRDKKLTPFAGTAAPVPPSPIPHLRAREGLVHVLMNHNDFVTIR
jgi:hypothetical protein